MKIGGTKGIIRAILRLPIDAFHVLTPSIGTTTWKGNVAVFLFHRRGHWDLDMTLEMVRKDWVLNRGCCWLFYWHFGHSPSLPLLWTVTLFPSVVCSTFKTGLSFIHLHPSPCHLSRLPSCLNCAPSLPLCLPPCLFFLQKPGETSNKRMSTKASPFITTFKGFLQVTVVAHICSTVWAPPSSPGASSSPSLVMVPPPCWPSFISLTTSFLSFPGSSLVLLPLLKTLFLPLHTCEITSLLWTECIPVPKSIC